MEKFPAVALLSPDGSIDTLAEVEIKNGTVSNFSPLLRAFYDIRSATAKVDLDPADLYTYVPWVRACTELRAAAISAIQVDVYDLKRGTKVKNPFPEDIGEVIYAVESDLCIFGAAYIHVVKKRRGGGFAVFRRYNPQLMVAEVDADKGLLGFRFTTDEKGQIRFRPGEMIYLRYYNPNSDLRAGVAPAKTAQLAANMALQANRHTGNFFKQGGRPDILLTTDIILPQSQIEEIQQLWRRLYTSTDNAWRMGVLWGGLKPQVIGSVPRDFAMQEILQEARLEICSAFRVPPVLVGATPMGNRATAFVARQQFYMETVFPEATLIERQINQYLRPLGYEIQFRFDLVEIFQEGLRDVPNVLELLREGVITQDEARAMLRIEKNLAVVPRSPGEIEAMDRAQSKGPDTNIGGQKALPEWEELRVFPYFNVEQTAQLVALKHWYANGTTKAKPGTNTLPPWVVAFLEERIASKVDPNTKEAFDVLLVDPWEWRLKEEEKLEGIVAPILEKYRKQAERAAREHNEKKLQKLLKELEDALYIALVSVFLRDFITIALHRALELQFGVSYEDVYAQALAWAPDYARKRARQLVETTEKRIRQLWEVFPTPEQRREASWEDLLSPVFGAGRAKTIATTETTYMYTAATQAFAKQLEQYGLETKLIWITARDEKVCPVCRPLDGKEQKDWGDFKEGPPAHPNCRCEPKVVIVKKRTGLSRLIS